MAFGLKSCAQAGAAPVKIEAERATPDYSFFLNCPKDAFERARQTLADALRRDADQLFTLTSQGLAFFGERFAMPFPQRSYDQVFLPMVGPTALWGLLYTIVLMFAMQGQRVLALPLDVVRIALPLLVYFAVMFGVGFWFARRMGFA